MTWVTFSVGPRFRRNMSRPAGEQAHTHPSSSGPSIWNSVLGRATREQIARSVVRAPASGRIVGLKVFTVGGVVSPGEMLMEVVPQDKGPVVDAKASPTDADDLIRGMETQVRFSALQERTLPFLHGTIYKISADGFEDERTAQRFFKIEVVVPPSELEKIRSVTGETGLRAGLPAEVMIPLRKRTALGYLTEPLTQTLCMSAASLIMDQPTARSAEP